jgi:two-component system response regulator PhcR
MPHTARTVLFVDDEPQSCKWFARSFSDEFTILTASGADAAMQLLREHGEQVAVLVTDHRMPGRSGVELLQAVQREGRHTVRLLVTAFAEKDTAIAAINKGRVLRILEKPIDVPQMRHALREAVSIYQAQALERALSRSRAGAMRDTLGFLAHELRTPLATVSGCVEAVVARHQPPEDGAPLGVVQFAEQEPGEVLQALERATRRVQYCQSLVTTFLASARNAHPEGSRTPVRAGALVQSLLDGYPFEADERPWVSCTVAGDFDLPAPSDLLYLVLCTLAKNALLALREQPDPCLRIEVSHGRIGFVDNGPGIAPDVLSLLTHQAVTTRSATGGTGMGLLFCQRVMQSIGGTVAVTCPPGAGTVVSLGFPVPPLPQAPPISIARAPHDLP